MRTTPLERPRFGSFLTQTVAVPLSLLAGLCGTLSCVGDAVEPDYSSELPRIAPTSAEDALKTFCIAPGFEIQLVAAEPLVTDPVAMAFDENGRLFVVEMKGYSENNSDAMGQVRLLEDQDGDGTFDCSTIFAQGLAWPTAIACFDGGVFVAVAPDVLYLRDEDGDMRADRRNIVFTGFGNQNVQGLVNSFRWGLDNRIHVATSSEGGIINSPNIPKQQPLVLRQRDLSFDPRSLDLTATSGGGQFGMSFNRWGHKFVCSNSDHIQMILAEDHYLRRNPYQAGPSSRRSIAKDGPQAAVFRRSPIEPWRIVRTRLRVSGEASGPVEGGGRAAGYFTSATGITIYEGDAWPEQYRGFAIVADVGSNLIHRKRLDPVGVGYLAHRVDSETEFVTSSDIWFRPVQFTNGPDGSLYIADMYREIVEHPWSLPPEIKRHLDLNSGRDRGRIYRIVPTGFDQPQVPRLGDADIDQLVDFLDHRNAWHRRTGARLLFERNDVLAAVGLRRLVKEGKLPEGRIAALYALSSLNELDENSALIALSDSHPQVRRHAVRLSESLVARSSKLTNRLFSLATESTPAIGLQLAYSLGELRSQQVPHILAKLARCNIVGNEDIEGAILSSVRHHARPVYENLAEDYVFAASKRGSRILAALQSQIERQDNEDDEELLALLEEQMRETPDVQELDPKVEKRREDVYRAYASSLDSQGVPELGKEAFKRCCSSCHAMEGVGNPLGPNLAAMRNRGAKSMLYNIIVPNREVNPKYQMYNIVTVDGKSLAGVIAEETATSIQIMDAEGKSHRVLRIDIDHILNTGVSMMPNGLEETLGRKGMADLLAYLTSEN